MYAINVKDIHVQFVCFYRACRLKKKAQHEAYKVKLYGLELEHRQLMSVLTTIRTQLKSEIDSKTTQKKTNNTEELSDLIKTNLSMYNL